MSLSAWLNAFPVVSPGVGCCECGYALTRFASLPRVLFPSFVRIVRRFIELAADGCGGFVRLTGCTVRCLAHFAGRGVCVVMPLGVRLTRSTGTRKQETYNHQRGEKTAFHINWMNSAPKRYEDADEANPGFRGRSGNAPRSPGSLWCRKPATVIACHVLHDSEFCAAVAA
jgi:hypothetical protein